MCVISSPSHEPNIQSLLYLIKHAVLHITWPWYHFQSHPTLISFSKLPDLDLIFKTTWPWYHFLSHLTLISFSKPPDLDLIFKATWPWSHFHSPLTIIILTVYFQYDIISIEDRPDPDQIYFPICKKKYIYLSYYSIDKLRNNSWQP